MRELNATYKGLITGLVMVAISFGIYYTKNNFNDGLQFVTYIVLIAGIIWTLVSYSKMPHAIRSFRNYFSQGFKCFIVVALVMVSFTYIFIRSDPSLKEEMAINARSEYEKKGNLTPDEIDRNVAFAKDNYIIMSVSATIFRYLFIGGLITAIVSIILIKTKGVNIDQNHTSFTGTKI